ncbi:Ubiquitin carboxyl-terminal hydrolase 51 [Phytophthora boehmeriae]|uniref:Ubiquitin carboxyl-terminal hydrolase n=1 Tax=Phytophthora boehmeriae TaxID=109152 RepID=A0A8T1X435_9STRA|nr:Ubiquitin carboxyl-terminal hydrolase 51 [Phytophthora boehmeriae]
MSAAQSGEKRARLLSSGSVCIHFTPTHLSSWQALGPMQAAETAAEVAQLQHYVQDQEARTDLSSDLFRCLSCPFRGIRETSEQQLQEIEDGEDDGSFMAHAILHNHVIAVMERKRHLYCASCRDFVYPDTAVGTEFRRRKRQRRSVMHSQTLLRRGLVNMGNTCFMSSVLQTLAHNPMLQHYFFVAKSHDTTICQQQRRRLLLKQKQQREKQDGETEDEEDDEGQSSSRRDTPPAITVCLGCELASFMAQLVPPLQQQKSLMAPPIAPQGILEAMWNAFPSFIGTAQHDAHELLIALLVHQHFSGVLRSELACGDCGTASHTFDPFLDVSLSLGEEKRQNPKDQKHEGNKHNAMSESSELTLEALLRIFTAEEELRGMNQVYCLRCSKYQTNYKRLTLHTIPNVLVFHIRRLDFYRQQKLKQTVRFPLTGLNMKPFTSADNADTTTCKKDSAGYEESDDVYDLVAVVNHHGDSVNGGHYTAFVRDELSKASTSSSKLSNGASQHQWILFDDVEVKTVSAAEVESSQACVAIFF